MCKLAGLKGHFTNHSLRATSASRLYAQGIDEQIIAETTAGHISNAVRSYKRTSNQQKEFASNIMNGEKRVKFESNVEHFNLKSDDKNISINLNFNFKFFLYIFI